MAILADLYGSEFILVVEVACDQSLYTCGCSCKPIDLYGSDLSLYLWLQLHASRSLRIRAEFIPMVANADDPVDLYGSDLSLYFELQLQVVGSG